jgi:hypothetical protein
MYCNSHPNGVFIGNMSKETRLNIRITPAFQKELKAIAGYYGLTVSSYVHSALVQKVRQERENNPDAFVATAYAAVDAGIQRAIPEDVGQVVPHPSSKKIVQGYVEEYGEMTATRKGESSRVNEKNLNLNAEESAERDDSDVSKPRKRAGGR